MIIASAAQLSLATPNIPHSIWVLKNSAVCANYRQLIWPLPFMAKSYEPVCRLPLRMIPHGQLHARSYEIRAQS